MKAGWYYDEKHQQWVLCEWKPGPTLLGPQQTAKQPDERYAVRGTRPDLQADLAAFNAAKLAQYGAT